MFPSDASVAEQNCFTTTALMLQLIAAKVPSKTVPMALLLSDTLAVQKFSVIQPATFLGKHVDPGIFILHLHQKKAKQKQLKRLQKRPLIGTHEKRPSLFQLFFCSSLPWLKKMSSESSRRCDRFVFVKIYEPFDSTVYQGFCWGPRH